VLFNQIFVGIPFAAFGYWMMKKPFAPIRVLPHFSSVLTGKFFIKFDQRTKWEFIGT
jgi:hypothetical protein